VQIMHTNGLLKLHNYQLIVISSRHTDNPLKNSRRSNFFRERLASPWPVEMGDVGILSYFVAV
jgi:hypothetical protein